MHLMISLLNLDMAVRFKLRWIEISALPRYLSVQKRIDQVD